MEKKDKNIANVKDEKAYRGIDVNVRSRACQAGNQRA